MRSLLCEDLGGISYNLFVYKAHPVSASLQALSALKLRSGGQLVACRILAVAGRNDSAPLFSVLCSIVVTVPVASVCPGV